MVKFEKRALVPRMPGFEAIAPYLRRIDDEKTYSNFGPLNFELTQKLAHYFGFPEESVCTIANATLGLQAVIQNSGLSMNQLIEVPAFTFAASPLSIISSGSRPFFIDIDAELRCVPTKNAQIVMDVLPFGANLRLADWCHNLQFLIVDAAASFDALCGFGNKFELPMQAAVVVSLHSTKLIGAGEGSVIISKDTELISRIKSWQNFGFEIGSNLRRDSQFYGTNAKMSEYASAVCLASLDLWPETRYLYKELNAKAMIINQDLGLIPHQGMSEGYATPNWNIFFPNVDVVNRVETQLAQLGYETRRWWSRGCHNMSAFANCKRSSLTNTEHIVDRYLGLPFHTYLPEDYWSMIHEVLSRASKGI